jgi:hypothetical protein
MGMREELIEEIHSREVGGAQSMWIVRVGGMFAVV